MFYVSEARMSLFRHNCAVPNFVVLFGPPASGKAAIGYELARMTGYRFFHNHLTADAAAALFGWSGERFSRTVDAMREMLFHEAASDLTIPGVIFTFLWALDLPEDTAAIERFADPFARSGGKVFFVELLARLNTRIEREGTAFRIGLKPSQRDVEAARARQIAADAQYRMNTGGVLPLGYPHLVVDTEAIDPPGAALRIKDTFAL